MKNDDTDIFYTYFSDEKLKDYTELDPHKIIESFLLSYPITIIEDNPHYYTIQVRKIIGSYLINTFGLKEGERKGKEIVKELNHVLDYNILGGDDDFKKKKHALNDKISIFLLLGIYLFYLKKIKDADIYIEKVELQKDFGNYKYTKDEFDEKWNQLDIKTEDSMEPPTSKGFRDVYKKFKRDLKFTDKKNINFLIAIEILKWYFEESSKGGPKSHGYSQREAIRFYRKLLILVGVNNLPKEGTIENRIIEIRNKILKDNSRKFIYNKLFQ